MMREDTKKKLYDLNLAELVSAIEEQEKNPQYAGMTFNERLDLADGAADVAAQDPVERAPRLHGAVDELRDKAAVLLAEVHLAQRLCKSHIGVGAVLMYFI